MANTYNLQKIRLLLTEGFTDTELRRLCYDRPDFRSVHNSLASNTGKDEIVDKLIGYADRQQLLDALLLLAKEQNPAKYADYLPYHDTQMHEPLSDTVTTEIKPDFRGIRLEELKVFGCMVRNFIIALSLLIVIGVALAISDKEIQSLIFPKITGTPLPPVTPTFIPSPTLTETPSPSPTSMIFVTPTDGPLLIQATPTPIPCPSPPAGWGIYTVQTGDTLSNLVVGRGTTTDQARQVNCLTSSELVVGQQLYLPLLPTPTPAEPGRGEKILPLPTQFFPPPPLLIPSPEPSTTRASPLLEPSIP